MKKYIRIFLLSLYLILLSQYSFSQNTDSLLSLIKTDKEDTNKVIHLNNLCNDYRSMSEYDKGLSFGKHALIIAQNLNYKKGIADSYSNIGVIYMNKGNYPEALKNYFSALKIHEESKDKKGIAHSYNNIGNIYLFQNNYSEALKNYVTVLKMEEEINDKHGIAISYSNIAILYRKQGNYSEALKNNFTALKIREEIKDKKGISSSYNNIGNIYINQSNYPEALKNYLASLKIKEEIGDKNGIASSYINFGQLYTDLNKPKEASIYLNKALVLSIKMGIKDAIKISYAGLVVLDSMTGNFKEAFEHHKLLILYSDSLNNEETKKKTLQASMQYEFDKKEIASKAGQEKLDAINREEKQKQKIIIYAVAGVLLLVIVFSLFLFNRFRITQRQKLIIEKQKQHVDHAYEQLHEKNKEVMDSIHYAKRIQTALITSEKYFENSLNRLMKKS